ncbi:Zn(II)2Cys6 transcription factor [Aspergillus ruber CBS 135680]|uniref:Zn(2)-C6 fungal-type domain-containing protein n=1 Tax=Aspergillus ruber (strain CBS 135680) TaxID=1388766 RepID=A0A017SBQ5_ASPRC|nr:uncharacterized protein EURHEDRAFT_523917 [Aspergillus ruber CBS 135680]EYE94473.1 hypothetical protein EURHEDRAFT_523917 [Aspergillus ruber CBS 135680]
MGGIPFKSTGCNTCRRRKVKCDETKPECLRCVKNGHICTGYERQRVFIHKSASAVNNSQKAQRPKRKDAAKSNRPAGAIIAVNLAEQVPRFNARLEVRSQLLASFINNFLPPAQLLKTNKNLYETLPDLIGGSPLLDKAVISLSSAFVAKNNRDDRLLQYSTKLYSQAMELLHRKIRMGKGLGKDLLYTTIIFQVYELINCSPSGFPAWLAHVQGSNALIQQCSGRSKEAVAENLFLRQLRFVILCDAIGKRQSPWRYNIPTRSSEPGDKNALAPEPIDIFIDILIECTALIEDVDTFLDHGYLVRGSRRVGERLLHSCLSLEDKLHNTCIWMQDKLGVPSPLSKDSSILKTFRTAVPKDFFPQPLNFPSLTCAESHLIYWTTLVLLYPLINQLFDFLSPGLSQSGSPASTSCYPSIESAEISTSPSTETLDRVDFIALTAVYATEVCRAAAYCLQPNMKALGGQMLLAPLSQSTQFFQVEQSSEKIKWCQAVFMHLPQVGFAIGVFLKDMVWPQYRLSQKRRSPTPLEQVVE